MYAEKSESSVNSRNSEQLIELLEERMQEIEKNSQKIRIGRIIKRIKNK